MLYVREAQGKLESTCRKLEEAAPAHQMGILGVHDLKEKMAEKGVVFDKACRIYEICNPQQAKTVLESSMGISSALPCRISVYEEQGKVKVATLKPTALLAMLGDSKDIKPVAEQVEKAIMGMIDDACT